jgi:hypothetical protein
VNKAVTAAKLTFEGLCFSFAVLGAELAVAHVCNLLSICCWKIFLRSAPSATEPTKKPMRHYALELLLLITRAGMKSIKPSCSITTRASCV